MASLHALRQRFGWGGFAVVGVIAAALVFIVTSYARDMGGTVVDTAPGRSFPCTVLSVYDGDGPINCSEVDGEGKQVKVRLRGIEARDADNSCRSADLCPAANVQQAKAELTRLAVGRLQCVSFGPSYDRVDAMCLTPTGADISCEMVRKGMAVRWPQYDPGGRLIPCIPGRRREAPL